jgi:hypothetical protein
MKKEREMCRMKPIKKRRNVVPGFLVLSVLIGLSFCEKEDTKEIWPGTQAAKRGSDAAPSEPRREPIPRKDAFFGLHFDLHPNASDTALGADISEENIRALLARVKPDFVQYDCKGHPGYTGYPAKAGWASPGIVKDSLAVWRKATNESGVGLYIHYSGVWDSKAIEEHPEWARIDADGKRDPNATSVFGPYVDELLIPQLKEVTSAYDLDGIWADGECWAAQLDYSPPALEAWKKETGGTDAPKDARDTRWLEWKMFHRRAFENYLCRWTDALHAFNPRLQITSNWMYSSFAPKPIIAKLDYLSGDYSWSLSVDRARVEARYLASTGMPWDLMAWGFTRGKELDWSLKPAVQLEQEAAVVLMQGGGFQIYNTPTRSGHIIDETIEQEGEVADFCRARQTESHKSTTVPQVALLLSAESHWDKSDRVFAPWGNEFDDLEGALHALLELHYSVDILAEHQLQPRLDEFPLVVIPDSHRLAEDFKQAVTAYVERGGSLLLIGEKCSRLFEPILGVTFEGEPSEAAAELASPTGIANAKGLWQRVMLTTAEPAGFRYPSRDARKNGETAASINRHGKGLVAAVFGPLSNIYFRSHHPAHREFIAGLMRSLFPDPALSVEGPPTLDVSLRRTAEGKTCVHLLNTSNRPMPDRYDFSDFVPSLGNIKLKIRMERRPKSVVWKPEGGSVDWSWKDGAVEVKIPKLHIHGVVVLE